MKVLIVHAYFNPEFEEAEILRTEREQRMVLMLREMGVESEHCMLTAKGGRRRADNPGRSMLFPVDRLHGNSRRSHFSKDLCQFLDSFQPDFVLFKGMGFKLAYRLYLGTRHCFHLGFIAGGHDRDLLSPLARLVFSESPFQSRSRFPDLREDCEVRFLPKLVPSNQLRTPDDPFEFDAVAVGNLIKRKNLEALSGVPEKLKVAVVGDGPMRNHLEAHFEGSRHIRMLGALEWEDALRLISRSRVLVHPARSEGVPRVVYEALSLGVPVVGLKSVLEAGVRHGSEALLVENDADIGPAVERLIEDRELYQRMSRNARAFSENYLGEEAFRAVVRFFADLVSRTDHEAPRKHRLFVWMRVIRYRIGKLLPQT